MRCDLHVHTKASGLINSPIIRHFCYESYNDAEAVYSRCKRLGMSIVTVTDHDSIDAAEVLRDRPDFFLSEEVTCTMPAARNSTSESTASPNATISKFKSVATIL